MALSPKPITLTQVASLGGPTPQPMVLVGDLNSALTPANFVVVDETPVDATAVATNLKAVVDSLIAAGLMSAS